MRQPALILPTFDPSISDKKGGKVSVFDKLVRQGETRSCVILSPVLHHFLVMRLLTYLSDIEIFDDITVTDTQFLKGSIERCERFGDTSLLIAGLFPEKAFEQSISISYYRFIGRAAYDKLARSRSKDAPLYRKVAEHFCVLEGVLGATRERLEPSGEAFLRFKAGILPNRFIQ